MFSYSCKPEDVGNNGSTIDIRTGRFALNLRFVIEQLYRVHAPGTNCCIHIQQLLAHKIQHGFMGRRDFRGATIDLFRAAGWQYAGEAVQPGPPPLLNAGDLRGLCEAFADDDAALTAAVQRRLGLPVPAEIAIAKDPQQMAQRLNLHSLQFKTGWGRTGTNWAPAPCDYLLIFQKPGEVAVPVRPLRCEQNPGGWMTKEDWILWARGTWEVHQFDVLDGWRHARATDQEKHVCPLQLEPVRRLVRMYSNPATVQPDVLVLDPFGGIGTVSVVCVEEGRNTVSFELKDSYARAAVANIEKAHRRAEQADADLFAQLPA